jgi:hypothetical protein
MVDLLLDILGVAAVVIVVLSAAIVVVVGLMSSGMDDGNDGFDS